MRRTPNRVQPEGVDDDGEPAPGPPLDDLVEDPEGVVGRVEVGRPAAHHRAERVGGHDLDLAIVRSRPRRLPSPGRADEEHQCGVGNLHRSSLAPSLLQGVE